MQSSLSADLEPCLDELHDLVVRVRAQLRVVRLAMREMSDECDVRAIISALDAVADELGDAARMIDR